MSIAGGGGASLGSVAGIVWIGGPGLTTIAGAGAGGGGGGAIAAQTGSPRSSRGTSPGVPEADLPTNSGDGAQAPSASSDARRRERVDCMIGRSCYSFAPETQGSIPRSRYQPMRPVPKPQPIVTAAEMRALERAAIKGGTSAHVLMRRAGEGAARAIQAFAGPAPTLVLCGPGNNGGDGYVVARALREADWPVRVAAIAPPATAEAAQAASAWSGPVEVLDDQCSPASILVDALFGIGLTRPLAEPLAAELHRLASDARTRVAIDVPSGVGSDDGALLGRPIAADLTVTFGALKPAHLLHPARGFAGRVVVADIGLPDADSGLTATVAPSFERPPEGAHKFSRGHVLVVGGPVHATGAARLAARAALRMGAGYVTLLAPGAAVLANAAQLTSIVLRRADDAAAVEASFADARVTALAIGPALGTDQAAQDKVLAALRVGKPVVLDADVFTLFADDPDMLFAAVRGPAVMTPHEGEFRRLFGDLGGSKVERARAAARCAGCVVLLKGPDSIVAEPGGRAAINGHASSWLATAGAGDVLTGMIAALLAQGRPPFDAACAAVWLHGDLGRLGGPGLIAEDLPELIPARLRMLA